MRKIALITSIVIACTTVSHSQTVFNEIFNEGNGAADGSGTTAGADALGTAWVATCPYCGPTGDWLEIDMAGDSELEAFDTNGPAFWETNDFDISACTEGITISVDIRETGTQEPVTCGGLCNVGDGIKFEVSYDGGTSWIAYSDAINGFTGTCVVMSECGTSDCNGCGACGTNPACETGNYPIPWGAGVDLTGPFIGTDDIGATAITFSDCASVGISNTMRFRLTFLCWSSSEGWFADNVLAVCSNCALPVELGHFTAQRIKDNAQLDWRTLGTLSNKKFEVERSDDGVIFYNVGITNGVINHNGTIDYHFIDEFPLDKKQTYYRVVQEDLNGKKKYSEIQTVYYQPTEIFYNGSEISVNFASAPNKSYTVNIYDLSGKLVHTEQMNESSNIQWDEKGFYIVDIPELEIRQKLVIQ